MTTLHQPDPSSSNPGSPVQQSTGPNEPAQSSPLPIGFRSLTMASINQAITTASGRVKWATSAPKRAATRYFGGEKKTWLVYWGLALGVFVVFMYVMVLGVNQLILWGDNTCSLRKPTTPEDLFESEGSLPMDSDSISAMCSIPTNTDISGVGVRAAVYFTMFCRVFLTSLASPQLASETRTATQVLSLCIVLAALVSAGMHTMSLPHAMVASNLISVTIWPVFVVEPMKESSPQSFWLGKLRYLAYMVLNVWLNVTTQCFGVVSNCNYTTSRSWLGVSPMISAVDPNARRPWLHFHISFFFLGIARIFITPGWKFHARALGAVWSTRASRRWAKEEMKIRRDFLARRRMRAAGGSLLQRVLMWLSIWAYSDAPPAPLPWFRPRGVSLYTAIGNVFKNVAIYRFFLGSTVVIILILDTEFLVKRSLGEEENIFTGFGQFMAMAQAVEVGLGVVWFLAVSGRSQGGEPGAVRACCGSGGPSVCARCAEDNASILSKSETGDLPISQSQATVSKPAGGVGIFIEGTRIEDEIASGSNESNPFADGDASSLHPSVHSNCSNARRTHRRNSSDLSGTGYELDDITNLRARNSINSSQV